MPGYRQGAYKLRHPEKYVGDPTKVYYRSSWELQLHKFFDNNPNILEWISEGFAIPYVKPTTGKVARYFPDYWIKYKDKNGNIKQEILEVKPDTQVNVRKRKRLTEQEKLTYAVNVAKWKAATQFCQKRGIKFRLLTENEIFRK